MDPQNIPSMQEMQLRQQQAAAMEEQRSSILEQILEPAAKDRISRLSLVKPEKARSVEDSLIMAAKNGKLQGKISDEQLVALLEQLSGGEVESNSGIANKKKNRINVQRRKYDIDDDDADDDDSDLM